MTEEEIRAIVRDEMAKAAQGAGGPSVEQTPPGGRVLTFLLVAAGIALAAWLLLGR